MKWMTDTQSGLNKKPRGPVQESFVCLLACYITLPLIGHVAQRQTGSGGSALGTALCCHGNHWVISMEYGNRGVHLRWWMGGGGTPEINIILVCERSLCIWVYCTTILRDTVLRLHRRLHTSYFSFGNLALIHSPHMILTNESVIYTQITTAARNTHLIQIVITNCFFYEHNMNVSQKGDVSHTRPIFIFWL